LYQPQVEDQRKTLPKPVIIKGEEEFEVEKNIKQKDSKRKKEVFSLIEGVYSRKRHLGK